MNGRDKDGPQKESDVLKLQLEAIGGLQAGNIMIELPFPEISFNVNA